MDTIVRTIFEDDQIIVVAKPSGMFVHRSDTWDQREIPLLQRVRDAIGQRVHIVHRLDRGTSGLVVLAKDTETARRMSQQFRARQVGKTYVGLVRGFCDQRGSITFPLSRKGAAQDRPDAEPSPDERSCQTDYHSRAQFEIPLPSGRYETTRCSLLEILPATGRWHQIRRHMNRINHPLIGDTTHGDNNQNRFFREQFALQRLMLAATGLRFAHPHSDEPLLIACEPDRSFQSVIDQLQPWRITIRTDPEL